MWILIVALLFLLWALVLCRLLHIDSVATMKRIVGDTLNKKQPHFLSNLFQVDERSVRHGGELVATVLKSHGVQEIFTLCGGHISPILVAAESLGIRVIDTRHEVTAVFAADAVARLRQSFGVAVVTAGPGVTNTITAVKNAQMAESPLLLIGGAAPTLLKDRGALQDIDQLVLFRLLCKFAARVTRLRDIIPTLRTAIHESQSGTPGPVFVEFPVDVLYPYQLVSKEIGFIKHPKNLKQKVVNAYLRMHILRQFGGAWLEQNVLPIPVSVPQPKEEDLRKVTDMILAAKRPLLILGSQATLPPVKPMLLKKAVEKLGIPVYLGGMSRGLLGINNRLHMRQNRKEALSEADVVVLAGTVCDFRLSYGRLLPTGGKIVSINRNWTQLTKNEGIFWKANVLIQADVATTLLKLSDRLDIRKDSRHLNEWLAILNGREQEKMAANCRKMKEKTADGSLNPLKVLSAIDEVLPEDGILIADGGDFVGSAAYVVRPRGPLQWLDPGAFGTLGVGGGFALGAKVVYPNRPVFILYGDGSCGYSLMEFDTFVRHKLPVVAFIGNDACWSQIAREQIPMFKSSVAVNLAHTSYQDVATALGARGELISINDEEDLVNRVRSVVDAARKEEPVIVNIIIGKTDFREGSISV